MRFHSESSFPHSFPAHVSHAECLLCELICMMAIYFFRELLQEKSIEYESLKTEKEEQDVVMAAIKKDCRETVGNLEEKLKNSLYLFQLASQSSRDKIR